MRMIDAELVLNTLCDECEEHEEVKELCPYKFMGCVYGALFELPTEDAEPVVRCKDCKHYDGKTGKCPVQSTGDPYLDFTPPKEWYCADGERRKDEID